ncbi:anaphase-promoting complex subunit 2 [Cladorrhinum sp. PSN332]|nr:anaphase-promoting complex subunit 2 [Cladorrhinum sp. PSN332]
MSATATAISSWGQERRKRNFRSVFKTDVSQPVPRPLSGGQTIGQPADAILDLSERELEQHLHLSARRDHGYRRRALHPSSSSITAQPQPLYPSFSTAPTNDHQIAYDRAWHTVTSRIALPASAAPESQQAFQKRASDSEFYDAFGVLSEAKSLLPQAARTQDVVAWHTRQVREHFVQHVVPLLNVCANVQGTRHSGVAAAVAGGREAARKGKHYERNMVIVMSSIKALENALRAYSDGLNELLSGFAHLPNLSPEQINRCGSLSARFRRDVHALVANSAPEGLGKSIRIVLVRLASTILGIPTGNEHGERRRPAPPRDDDFTVLAASKRLADLVGQLHNVGLTGERFEVLFAQVMDSIMSKYVIGAYGGVWSDADAASTFPAHLNSVSRGRGTAPVATSPCIRSLQDWVENHFAKLNVQVLNWIGATPMSLTDLKTAQSLALGRLAALRIREMYDIVLAWPDSRGALDDLRAAITTPARRQQLKVGFSRVLQKRLLHPGCSTLEILRTYIAIIRTLHALDHSKVLLSHIEPALQLYLCQRDDAVRVVVSGLLASPEEQEAVKQFEEKKNSNNKRKTMKDPFSTPAVVGPSSSSSSYRTPPPPQQQQQKKSNKLVELASLLSETARSRRGLAVVAEEDHELDWDDMSWVPDPVDAGANYKRPKSEDVIGTLISALGSGDVFIKEFSTVVADRLLEQSGSGSQFDQETLVLDLLKRRFGEPALQNCDVMIKDIKDSRRLDAQIVREKQQQQRRGVFATPVRGGVEPSRTAGGKDGGDGQGGTEYHARILSRLFWPKMEKEHFLLPEPIVEQQREYEKGYERLKAGRKLTWLNQLGQTRVELEFRGNRTPQVFWCGTVEATVIYAFGDDDSEDGDDQSVKEKEKKKKSIEELYMELQMDEDLIAGAIKFWVERGVLRRVGVVGADEYAVVESLEGGEVLLDDIDEQEEEQGEEGEQKKQQAAMASAAVPALNARERERREMYWRYIQGMLTNARSTMPLAQMAMMMKMLIPEGFQWGNDELQEFLAAKVADGEMEVVGGKYKLVKK